MTNAKIDENGRNAIIALLDTDGSTITPICANGHSLCIDDNTTGSDNGGGSNAKIDENGRNTLTALSSDGSGAIINLYVNSSNQLLINSM